MHLFASFIFRALLILCSSFVWQAGMDSKNTIRDKNGELFLKEGLEKNNWPCKLFVSLWQYFYVANYSWILMEGFYLHNLIYMALFADNGRNITKYIIMGWGLPVLVIIPWITSRILTENEYSWTIHKKSNILIIKIPIILSIMVKKKKLFYFLFHDNIFLLKFQINFILFIKITLVIYSKLQAPVYEEAGRYRKLARSTLILLPLFGVPYAIFLGLSYYIGKDEILELMYLFADQTFASFQVSPLDLPRVAVLITHHRYVSGIHRGGSVLLPKRRS